MQRALQAVAEGPETGDRSGRARVTVQRLAESDDLHGHGFGDGDLIGAPVVGVDPHDTVGIADTGPEIDVRRGQVEQEVMEHRTAALDDGRPPCRDQLAGRLHRPSAEQRERGIGVGPGDRGEVARGVGGGDRVRRTCGDVVTPAVFDPDPRVPVPRDEERVVPAPAEITRGIEGLFGVVVAIGVEVARSRPSAGCRSLPTDHRRPARERGPPRGRAPCPADRRAAGGSHRGPSPGRRPPDRRPRRRPPSPPGPAPPTGESCRSSS